MLLEEALFQQLAENGGIAAIVGDRIYPVEIPQFQPGVTTYPCLVYRLGNRPGLYTVDGALNAVESTIEIFCLSTGYLEAKRLARGVRRALDNVVPGQPLAVLSVDLLGVLKLSESDSKEIDAIEELDVFNITQTWQVRHVEE